MLKSMQNSENIYIVVRANYHCRSYYLCSQVSSCSQAHSTLSKCKAHTFLETTDKVASWSVSTHTYSSSMHYHLSILKLETVIFIL